MNEHPFCRKDLQFFGVITAGISHELKNVVTIINESGGLLHDLSLGAESGRRPLDPSRVKKLSVHVSRNVERAVEIINRMNRFAHSVDEPRRSFDLTQLVADAVALATRFASVRGVELRVELPASPVTIESYVYGLHRAIFTAIQIAVLDVQSLRPATVNLQATPEGAEIAIARDAIRRSDEFEARLESIQGALAQLGGSADIEGSPPEAEAVVMRVPSS